MNFSLMVYNSLISNFIELLHRSALSLESGKMSTWESLHSMDEVLVLHALRFDQIYFRCSKVNIRPRFFHQHPPRVLDEIFSLMQSSWEDDVKVSVSVLWSHVTG